MLHQLRGILFHVKSERMVSALPVRWTRIAKNYTDNSTHFL